MLYIESFFFTKKTQLHTFSVFEKIYHENTCDLVAFIFIQMILAKTILNITKTCL